MSKAHLREALVAAAPAPKEKGPPVPDGILTVSSTDSTAEGGSGGECRSKTSLVKEIASSTRYLDEQQQGTMRTTMHPENLYGKFTWKLERFSEASKRELRSTTFEVGGYKWYILVYPHGCDVTNHLSLFLCVADYDKLLPGWSHFAQFTIAVVNKDPKKSKYSDTLHRFCKKEHDWGWKKFMELSKISDGYCTNDTLIIKAQVQVIQERPSRPACMLDAQYRKELLRVYLGNVEGILKRFIDEKRDTIGALLSQEGFVDFWESLDSVRRVQLMQAPASGLLKAMVKRFFNEKEVTSTLIMDALCCGAKSLEVMGRRLRSMSPSSSGNRGIEYRGKDHAKFGNGAQARVSCSPNDRSLTTSDAIPSNAATLTHLVIDGQTDRFVIAGDALHVLQHLASEPLPNHFNDKGLEGAPTRCSCEENETTTCKDSVERDERRLVDLGIRMVEIYAAADIAESQLRASWVEAETIKRQEELIREEEEADREEAERAAARSEAERERRARKKERQRAKKEAERARKEAEEAERLRVEEEKKFEAARKQREAEERKRREQAMRDEERQRQLTAAMQQAAEARKRSIESKNASPSSESPGSRELEPWKEGTTRKTETIVGVDGKSGGRISPLDPSSEDATASGKEKAQQAKEATNFVEKTMMERSNVTTTPMPSSEEEDEGEREGSHSPGVVRRASREESPQGSVVRTNDDGIKNGAIKSKDADDSELLDARKTVRQLGDRVRELEAQLAERDTLVLALQARVSELEKQLISSLENRDINSKVSTASRASLSRPLARSVETAHNDASGNGSQLPAEFAQQSVAKGHGSFDRDGNSNNGTSSVSIQPLTGTGFANVSANPSDGILAASAPQRGALMHPGSGVVSHGTSNVARTGIVRQSSAPSTPGEVRIGQVVQAPRPHSSALPSSPLRHGPALVPPPPPQFSPSGPQQQAQAQNGPMGYAKVASNVAKHPPGFSNVPSSYRAVVTAHSGIGTSNANHGADVLAGHVGGVRGSSATTQSNANTSVFNSSGPVQSTQVASEPHGVPHHRRASGGLSSSTVVSDAGYDASMAPCPSTGMESPGLDDFAHMGLITDLLE